MKKIFVFSNLAMSLDGKIGTVSREFFPIGSPHDRKMMQTLRKRSDAVLMGASTLRTFRRPCRIVGAKFQPMNVIVSTCLEGISPSWPFFTTPDIRRVLFVARRPSNLRLRAFQRTSQVILLPDADPSAPAILEALSELGIRNLLVEGGGGVMWDFARDNLIDEYNVTLVPKILGGTEAPTLVDGAGFLPSEILNLRLKSVRRVRSELYLTYAKTPRRG